MGVSAITVCSVSMIEVFMRLHDVLFIVLALVLVAGAMLLSWLRQG